MDGALASYLRALEVQPAEHRILWKLAKVHERRQDWSRMAETLTRAVELAPGFASYWFKLGNALINEGDGGDRSAYERAKVVLKRCIELDPNIAECHHLFGEASLWTGDERSALLGYSQAIARKPNSHFFYTPLADLYLSLAMYPQAEAVLKEGTRQVPKVQVNSNSLYGMYMMLALIAQRRQDNAAQLWALEQAEVYAGERHPELAFNLGSTYAIMTPPNKERALALLERFITTVCQGDAAAKFAARFAEQCGIARALVSRLGAP